MDDRVVDVCSENSEVKDLNMKWPLASEQQRIPSESAGSVWAVYLSEGACSGAP